MSVSQFLRNQAFVKSGVNFSKNSKAFTVGNGGNFATLDDAVQVIGDRRKVIQTSDENVAIFTGTDTLIGTGTTWKTDGVYRTGGFIQLEGDTNYYRIKEITNDTQIILHEGVVGQIFPSAVSEIVYSVLDWNTIFLLAGHHNSPDTGIDMFSGISLCGLEKDSTLLNEIDSTPQGMFNNWGENNLAHLHFAPTDAWGALDALIGSLNTDLSGGCMTRIEHCRFDFRNLNGDHTGGSGRLPVPAGGLAVYKGCEIISDGLLDCDVNGRVTETVSNTGVVFNDTDFMFLNSYDAVTSYAHPLVPTCMYVDEPIRYDLNRCNVDMTRATNQDVLAAPAVFSGVYVDAPAIVNINNTPIKLENNGFDASGIVVASGAGAAVVNVGHCDIEAIGVVDKGVHCLDAAATINLRHSRVKGGTNSIHAAAGTINYDTATTLIGTNTGGTALNT